MPNYKIRIQYDGTDFFGWQSQPNGNTIQDEISNAVALVAREEINLIGSGRTDSGVHALGQVANFKLNNTIDEYKFKHSINSVLPSTISLSDIELVNDKFHARFDAIKRSYIYLISKSKSPFLYRYSYNYPYSQNIDIENIKMLSKQLLGEHDFTSFCRTNTDTLNKICIINDISWRETKEGIIFKIEANRFLHGMVRTIVGTLLSCNHNNSDEQEISKIILSKNRTSAGESVPAKGLFLFKVKY